MSKAIPALHCFFRLQGVWMEFERTQNRAWPKVGTLGMKFYFNELIAPCGFLNLTSKDTRGQPGAQSWFRFSLYSLPRRGALNFFPVSCIHVSCIHDSYIHVSCIRSLLTYDLALMLYLDTHVLMHACTHSGIDSFVKCVKYLGLNQGVVYEDIFLSVIKESGWKFGFAFILSATLEYCALGCKGCVLSLYHYM